MDTLSVLIIEDSRVQAHALVNKLLEAGVPEDRISFVHDLATAMSSPHHDVILCDLNLPDSEGSNTIRAVANGSALIVVSNHINTQESVQDAYQAGAHLAIPKKDILAMSPYGVRAILEFARIIKKDLVRRKQKQESLLSKINELAYGRITADT